MGFNIRQIEEDDLPEILQWFVTRKWPMPAVDGVGPKIGVLAEKNGIKYACVYAYMTGTSVVYIEWSSTNPDVPLTQSMQAFDDLITHYKRMCEQSEPKVRVLCLTTQSAALASRFKKHGFRIEGDYFRAVWTLNE